VCVSKNSVFFFFNFKLYSRFEGQTVDEVDEDRNEEQTTSLSATISFIASGKKKKKKRAERWKRY